MPGYLHHLTSFAVVDSDQIMYLRHPNSSEMGRSIAPVLLAGLQASCKLRLVPSAPLLGMVVVAPMNTDAVHPTGCRRRRVATMR